MIVLVIRTLVIRTLAKAARPAMADSRVGGATSLQITVMVMAARQAPATGISIVVALAAGDRSVPPFPGSAPPIGRPLPNIRGHSAGPCVPVRLRDFRQGCSFIH
jgi:hypothetical protein